ncbi:hypothetical protein BC567DRAFT_264409 [Phyllosticta citribraziliensis]
MKMLKDDKKRVEVGQGTFEVVMNQDSRATQDRNSAKPTAGVVRDLLVFNLKVKAKRTLRLLKKQYRPSLSLNSCENSPFGRLFAGVETAKRDAVTEVWERTGQEILAPDNQHEWLNKAFQIDKEAFEIVMNDEPQKTRDRKARKPDAGVSRELAIFGLKVRAKKILRSLGKQ